MKTKPSGAARAQLLSDEFDEFVRQVCALSPKVGVASYQPIEESGAVLFYVPVRSPRRANNVFDPTEGKWVHCEMLAADYMTFALDYTGTRRSLSPVPEADESMEFYLPIESAASVSEVLEFYFDAASNCRASIAPVTNNLSAIVGRVFCLVWLDRKPRLLPLDDVKLLRRLPQLLSDYLTAFLRDDLNEAIRLGGTYWSDLCGEHKKELRRLPLVVPEVNDLIARTSDLRFRVSPPDALSLGILAADYPRVVLRVNLRRSSELFCEELFGHIAEGVVALRDCFRGCKALSDLPQRLALTRVLVPDSRMGQIRYAMELRATRHAASKTFDGLIGKPRSLANAVRTSRAMLRKLTKLSSSSREL